MPTFNELIRTLKKHGGVKVREKGSKQLWDVNGNRVWVHFHGSKEVSTGTYRETLKQAGITEP